MGRVADALHRGVTDHVIDRAPVRAPDRTWLVAAAAALWGTDALLRKPLADALPAATVVFWEHAITLVVLLPWLPAAWAR